MSSSFWTKHINPTWSYMILQRFPKSSTTMQICELGPPKEVRSEWKASMEQTKPTSWIQGGCHSAITSEVGMRSSGFLSENIIWVLNPKIGGNSPPKSSHFNRVWNHYKPSILGVFPLFLVQHPCLIQVSNINWSSKQLTKAFGNSLVKNILIIKSSLHCLSECKN